VSTTPFPVWVWRGSFVAKIAFAAMVVLVSFAAFAADVLFPQPLHLTRRIEDPVSQSVTVVEEYCAGNRVVTVSGERVSIADYARQELTEIDRAAGTYSVTTFAEIANATPAPRQTLRERANAVSQEPWKSKPLGMKSSPAGKSIDAYEVAFERAEGRRVTIEVGIDRSVRLSREAVTILLGAAFPNPHNDAHDAMLDAAAPVAAKAGNRPVAANTAIVQDYGLPTEQVTTFEIGEERIIVRNTITGVRTGTVPDELLVIPPGAKRVESHAVRVARELRELDRIPSH
jgi:hypothetical protein